jgi:hypothetical protein
MLATLGWVASGFVQLPGAVHQVNAIQAHDAAVASGAMSQILLWVSFFEIISLKVIGEMMDKENPTNRLPGDFSFDPFDLYFGRNEATQKDMVCNVYNCMPFFCIFSFCFPQLLTFSYFSHYSIFIGY